MLRKRVLKITFVLACILTLIMPYTSTVLAKALTKEDTTAELRVQMMYPGGDESSGTLTDEQKEVYDTEPHQYRIGETRLYKIIRTDDKNAEGSYLYSDSFYCVNANKVFPGITDDGRLASLVYTKVADLKDSLDSNVRALHLGTSSSENSELWNSNYKSLVWLADNMYLAKQAPEQKAEYLAKAFADFETVDLDSVKAILTDDDIDVIQQYAIWYFTNGDTEKYNTETLPAVNVDTINEAGTELVETSYLGLGNIGSEYRQEIANHLYQYLIKSAKEAKTTKNVTYPTLIGDNEIDQSKLLQEANYYIAGPIKVTSGTAEKSEYSLKLLDQDGKEIPTEDYKLYIEGENSFTNKKISDILDKNFYIYLPTSNKDITSMNVELNYTTYEITASLWKDPTDTANKYQPAILLTKDPTPHKSNLRFNIDRKTADLALRKYIASVNGKSVDRIPKVDVSGLKDGTSETAIYKHSKEPISISNGDTVVYEIRVYNEADIDASGVVIVDYLPKGLEIVEDSKINEDYGWKKGTEGNNGTVYSTDYLKNETIKAFNKNSDQTLDSKFVQIECKIARDAVAGSILTNIAEIAGDNIDDRDSTPGNNDYINKDYDSSKYEGDSKNKTDLTDSDYHYKGTQDDDDFEKVIVEGKTFDLNLKKFITKINNAAPKTSREPVVDVTDLKKGTSTNAKYETTKTKLVVEKGDIVTYTLRVYNEGELSGYAEEVADYLPEGLGFLVGHITNEDNYWKIPEDCKTVKLSTIDNAVKNLSLDNFKDIKDLKDVDVVVGKAKLVSTKLKSDTLSDKNIIKGFDPKTGTKLDYKDIQVTCVVIADEVTNVNLRNIAEINKASDENGNTTDDKLVDRDSKPGTVNPDNYPGDDSKQDDHDYENLTNDPREFDLSLQKFITKVNDKAVSGREPKVSVNSQGKVQFTSSKEPLSVENNDIITYTIRVYNEGNIAGYAKEVSDNLPKGLVYLPDNEINKKYGWKLYDKNGNETSNIDQAERVATDYLSKEKSEARKDNCLIEAFDQDVAKTPHYKDIQIAFRIDQSKVEDGAKRLVKNTAEITDDEDENGNPVDDVDSTPGNNKDGEDDIDNETVYVKYFDLALQKDLVKIIVIEDGTTREIAVSPTDGLQKVEVHRKKIKSTIVKFVYNITVKNEGEIEGYATEITDYIPDGLEFIAEENSQWTQAANNIVKTNALSNTLLKPGQTASVQITLKWTNGENNFNMKVNTAEISADKNNSNTPDRDSTPNNKVPTEDDIDTAPVILMISTGATPTYLALSSSVIAILTTGIVLIKKYVLI